MRCRTSVLLVSMLLTAAGCDLRTMDPRWNSLSKKGVSSIPGRYDFASCVQGVTDEQFASAVPDLRSVGVKELHLQDTRLTDASIDGLLQLQKLERLNLVRTDFTVDGLVRLAALPRLKWVYVPHGQFTDEELGRLRHALPNAQVHAGILGAERFRDIHPTTQPGAVKTRKAADRTGIFLANRHRYPFPLLVQSASNGPIVHDPILPQVTQCPPQDS